MANRELVQQVLDHTELLRWPRGERLPLYLWPMMDIDTDDAAETEALIRQLDARGIGVVSSWNPARQEESLTRGLQVARILNKLGLPVNINATSCTYAFCNGNPHTAHRNEYGEPFFDGSFAEGTKMGCPFALDWRRPTMRKRVEDFVQGYQTAGLPIDFVFADWEVDGPIEWNDAWTSSKQCVVCRKRIPNIGDFRAFQTALREKRSELQRDMLAEPVKAAFPDALVGNYGVYPHDGFRYWYDYFERFVEGAPYKADIRAKYREWYDEFPLTGYTFAMPVVYPWESIWRWYDHQNADYRWFYNMLLVGSNAAKHTPPEIPIITFVHWHTVFTTGQQDPDIQQFSAEKYQELLWHLLLRGHDSFFMWCPHQEAISEAQLVHQVYAASLEYEPFLTGGTPVSFDVPTQAGPVISGIRLGKRLLLRRTDFDGTEAEVPWTIDGMTLHIPRVEGECQILSLDQ